MGAMTSPYDAEPVDRLPFGSPEKAARYATDRYLGATGLNWWRCDPTLQLLARKHLTTDELAWAEPHLDRTFTLVTPPFGCSTPAVYRAWDEMGGPAGDHGNDLEPAALRVEPRLASWRDQLGEVSGARPRLAGSGSTWFVEGAFPGEGRRVVATTPSGWTGPSGPG